jgi:hypothetical protein
MNSTGFCEASVRSALALLTRDSWATKAPNPNASRRGPAGFVYALDPAYWRAVEDLLILTARVRESRLLAEAAARGRAIGIVAGSATDQLANQIAAQCAAEPIAAVEKGQRLTAEYRIHLAAQLRARYVVAGRSIRELMEKPAAATAMSAACFCRPASSSVRVAGINVNSGHRCPPQDMDVRTGVRDRRQSAAGPGRRSWTEIRPK